MFVATTDDRDRCASSRSAATKPTRSSSRAPGATSRTATRRRTLVPTRRAQVEYEAYLSLLARDAGVDTPRVVVAGTHGALALLVVEQITGTELFELTDDAVRDDLLDRTWAELRTLHAARVAHGKLDGHHVLVDGSAPRIVGFDFASTSARFRQTAGDVAQLLAATAAVVGSRARGRRGGARHGPRDASPPRSRSSSPRRCRAGPTTRSAAATSSTTASTSSARVAAEATGTEAPELRRLYRVHPRSLLMAVGALVGVGVLLSRVGDPACSGTR